MDTAKKRKEKAGIVAYRRVRGELLVLLVTARKFKDTWVFPVGTVKSSETLEVAAERECQEESGYVVDVESQLSAIEIADGKTKTRFTFFLASVVGELTHWEKDRTRKWVPVRELADALPQVFRAVALEAARRLT